jgi:putative transposase
MVGNNVHHLEWCPKRRYKIFRRPDLMKVCDAAIRGAAARHRIGLVELSVLPDHVHAVAELPLDMAPSRALGLLKGASSYEIFRAVPNFRKRYPRGHLWSRGKMARSIGGVTMDVVRKYVRGQYVHHGLQNPAQTSLSAFS